MLTRLGHASNATKGIRPSVTNVDGKLVDDICPDEAPFLYWGNGPFHIYCDPF